MAAQILFTDLGNLKPIPTGARIVESFGFFVPLEIFNFYFVVIRCHHKDL